MGNIVAGGLIASKVSTQFIQPFIGSGTTTTTTTTPTPTTTTTTTTTTTVAPGFIITIFETQATIFARTGDAAGVIAYGTDTLDYYVADGNDNWSITENVYF